MLLLNVMTEVPSISIWASIPFIIILLMVAVGPQIAGEWWENNRNKLIVSAVLSIPVLLMAYFMDGHIGEVFVEKLHHQVFGDYVPFIVLLTALFVVTGNIHLSGDIEGKPWINTLFLGIGFMLASIMGTTGAAMLLIRPIINTNSQRKYNVHTILFFIALVANAGGLLTPLGDPPLLMLYLRNAPFTWFITMLPEWATVGVLLLTIYFIWDTILYKKEPKVNIVADASTKEPIRLRGTQNFIYLAAIVFAVALINPQYIPSMAKVGDVEPSLFMKNIRELVLVILAILSWYSTKKEVRTLNDFSWVPILEVAALFVGIFITMTPTLMYLDSHAASLGITEPWQFYYTTGFLSSFLDNTPTCVAFHSVAVSLEHVFTCDPSCIPFDLRDQEMVAGVRELILKAISMGAVFFGAMTYIGNGPNFMVKAIAEEKGVKMPSFFGYMLKFSLIVVLPVYVIVQLLFL